MSDEDDLNVDAAYALETPDDNKKLYAAWAETYDEGFAEAKNFLFPGHIAATFLRRGGVGPVLDVGAGTGLVAQELLERGDFLIDAFDLSAEMLAIAREKNVYRSLMQGDLLQPLSIETDSYNGVVSSGTFTHGHVGPGAFDELLRVASPGALFALSIKTELYETHGFKAKLDSFADRVEGLELDSFKVYGPGADPDHAEDTALVASFRKA